MATALPIDGASGKGFAAGRDGQEYAENYSRFLVIGGGVSGLSAALHLSGQGVTDYKLLEARNRLGGRVITVQIGENTRTDLS